MNDYYRLVKLQNKREKLADELRSIDEQINELAVPMRAALKLRPSRPRGRPKGSAGMDRVTTALKELGPQSVGDLSQALGMTRVAVYKLADRLKTKGVIVATKAGTYALVEGYVPGSEVDTDVEDDSAALEVKP